MRFGTGISRVESRDGSSLPSVRTLGTQELCPIGRQVHVECHVVRYRPPAHRLTKTRQQRRGTTIPRRMTKILAAIGKSNIDVRHDSAEVREKFRRKIRNSEPLIAHVPCARQREAKAAWRRGLRVFTSGASGRFRSVRYPPNSCAAGTGVNEQQAFRKQPQGIPHRADVSLIDPLERRPFVTLSQCALHPARSFKARLIFR